MQLTGELKEKVEKAETKEEAKQTIENAGMFLSDEDEDKVEKAETKEEAKKVIEDAGMILDDAELDKVAGGSVIPSLPGSRPADL